MAGRCLGELVRKMGERVLGHIIPILQQGMGAEEASTRQGVCYGMKELLDNITRQQLAEHLGALLPTVQAALVDLDPGVRQASPHAPPAAQSAFQGIVLLINFQLTRQV